MGKRKVRADGEQVSMDIHVVTVEQAQKAGIQSFQLRNCAQWSRVEALCHTGQERERYLRQSNALRKVADALDE